jgi:hypothetical protein
MVATGIRRGRGDPFMGEPAMINASGYLVAGNPLFGPIFVPRNLTPNSAGRPAGMTVEQFIHTIRTGQDGRVTGPLPDSSLLQMMPCQCPDSGHRRWTDSGEYQSR